MIEWDLQVGDKHMKRLKPASAMIVITTSLERSCFRLAKEVIFLGSYDHRCFLIWCRLFFFFLYRKKELLSGCVGPTTKFRHAAKQKVKNHGGPAYMMNSFSRLIDQIKREQEQELLDQIKKLNQTP